MAEGNSINVILEVFTDDCSVKVKTSSSTQASSELADFSSQTYVDDLPSPVPADTKLKCSREFDKVFVYDMADLTMLLSERELEKEPDRLKSKCFLNFVKKSEMTMISALYRYPDDNDELDLVNIEKAIGRKKSDYEDIRRKNHFLKYVHGKLVDDMKMKNDRRDSYSFDCRWSYAEPCLELVNQKSGKDGNKKYANIALCEDGILHGAASLGYSGLSKQIPLENVYSTATKSIETVLKMIQKRFGEHCKMVLATSNQKTLDVARNLLIHAWPIQNDCDFDALYKQQKNHWLPKEKEKPVFQIKYKIIRPNYPRSECLLRYPDSYRVLNRWDVWNNMHRMAEEERERILAEQRKIDEQVLRDSLPETFERFEVRQEQERIRALFNV